MPFTVKNWQNGIAGGTPVSEAALEDMEARLAAYTDLSVANEPTSSQKAALVGTNGTPSVSNKFVTDSDPRNTDQRTPLDASVAPDKLTAAYAATLGVSQTGTVRRGKSIIPGGESTSATSYAVGNLATPDRVSGIVLPTDSLIGIAYQAIWQNTVTTNALASIFIGASQMKKGSGSGAPAVQEASGPIETNDDGLLFTSPTGLTGVGGAGAATEVTTGQMIGCVAQNGSPVCVFAAAGTYDISIQFRNIAAGTLTVKNRHLWVWTMGF